eukprot:Awhi_evm2s373
MEAVRIVSNLISGGTKEQIEKLVDLDCLSFLVPCLYTNSNEETHQNIFAVGLHKNHRSILTLGLQAIYDLLLSDRRYFPHFKGATGLLLLESLQWYEDQDIKEMVIKIVNSKEQGERREVLDDSTEDNEECSTTVKKVQAREDEGELDDIELTQSVIGPGNGNCSNAAVGCIYDCRGEKLLQVNSDYHDALVTVANVKVKVTVNYANSTSCGLKVPSLQITSVEKLDNYHRRRAITERKREHHQRLLSQAKLIKEAKRNLDDEMKATITSKASNSSQGDTLVQLLHHINKLEMEMQDLENQNTLKVTYAPEQNIRATLFPGVYTSISFLEGPPLLWCPRVLSQEENIGLWNGLKTETVNFY